MSLHARCRAGVFALFLALPLAGCGGGLLPAERETAATRFETYDQVVDAFEQVVPGRTSDEDLVRIGFDARTGNVQVLSYLGIQERMMPRDSVKFDRLNPAVRACITAEIACTAYAFHPEHTSSKRIGNPVLDVLGFRRVTRNEHWQAEVLLLIHDGVVIHKVFSGSPRTESIDDRVRPLGPLQDLSNALLSGAKAGGAL